MKPLSTSLVLFGLLWCWQENANGEEIFRPIDLPSVCLSHCRLF